MKVADPRYYTFRTVPESLLNFDTVVPRQVKSCELFWLLKLDFRVFMITFSV